MFLLYSELSLCVFVNADYLCCENQEQVTLNIYFQKLEWNEKEKEYRNCSPRQP